MTDERKNLPSASGFYRLLMCPGSWTKNQNLPEILKPQPSKDGEEGTRRHELIADNVTEDDDSNTEWVINEAQRLTTVAAQTVFGDYGTAHAEEVKEERFWQRGEDFEPIFSGKVDLAYIGSDGKLLIIDYKTLWGDHGTAETNEQLACYAALIAQQVEVKEAYLALIQPNLPADRRLSIARMSSADITAQIKKIDNAVKFALNPDAPLNAGSHCKYCPVLAGCEAAKAKANWSVFWASERQDLKAITAEDLAQIEWFEMYAKEVKAKAKEALKTNPDAIDGYELGKGRTITSIADESKALDLAAEAGPECVKSILSVSLTKFKTAWWHHLKTIDPKTKRKDAEADLKARLADALIEKTTEAPLQKTK